MLPISLPNLQYSKAHSDLLLGSVIGRLCKHDSANVASASPTHLPVEACMHSGTTPPPAAPVHCPVLCSAPAHTTLQHRINSLEQNATMTSS